MAQNHRRPRREAAPDAADFLRAALQAEQERSALWQRRAEALEEVAKRAYAAASWGGAVRREPSEPSS
jgi:hypothetical protein